jgi:DNA repair protein RecO (recombination protein O)
MSKTYNAMGIVLRRYDYREHDRLFVLYTKEYGKIEVVAKGTKKILSKLNPHLEPYNEVKVMVAHGKGFDKLGNATAQTTFKKLKEDTDITTTAIVSYVLEATEKMLQSRFADEQMYEVLKSALSYIEKNSTPEMSLGEKFFLANVYILKMLDQLGYRPDLTRCGECNKGIVFPKLTYDFLRGGLVCESCKPITLIHDHYDISDSVIKILNTVLAEGFQTLENFSFQKEDQKEFNVIVSRLLAYQLPRELKSVNFIKSLF